MKQGMDAQKIDIRVSRGYHSAKLLVSKVEVWMRQRVNCVPAVLGVLLLASSAAFAHHSVAGQFDTSKALTLKGTISKVNWMNPHIYVFLDVKEADGNATQWT